MTFTLSAAGTASWIFRYRHAGKQREMTLGNYPDMALEKAREAARAARVMVDLGKDVAVEKRPEPKQLRRAPFGKSRRSTSRSARASRRGRAKTSSAI